MKKLMFGSVTGTWNPTTGCRFACSYCYALDMAEKGRVKYSRKYANGFRPTFHPDELHRNFKPGEFVFVTSMGDLFTDGILPADLNKILGYIAEFPDTDFLLQSKAARYSFATQKGIIPSNCYLGVTIESNRYYYAGWHSRAPATFNRCIDIVLTPRIYRRFLSIEPIVDFDLEVLVPWIRDIRPQIIEIGADNHNKGLPEPPWEKVGLLIEWCRHLCPQVRIKDGLERLKNGR